MLMMVVREQSLNRGINAQCLSLSSVFLRLLCQIPSSCSCCTLSRIISALIFASLTFHLDAAERKEQTVTSSVPVKTTLKDSIAVAEREAIYRHLATVA